MRPLKDKSMDIFDMLRWAADIGFQAVDITGYYFDGYPHKPEPSYLYRIKRQAHALGIEISGTGIRNDFTIPEKALRMKEKEKELWTGYMWLPIWGAPVLRILQDKKKEKDIPVLRSTNGLFRMYTTASGKDNPTGSS